MWSTRIGGQSVKVIYLAKLEIDRKIDAHFHVQLEDSIPRPHSFSFLRANCGTRMPRCSPRVDKDLDGDFNYLLPSIESQAPHSAQHTNTWHPLRRQFPTYWKPNATNDRRKRTQWNRSDSSTVFYPLVCFVAEVCSEHLFLRIHFGCI